MRTHPLYEKKNETIKKWGNALPEQKPVGNKKFVSTKSFIIIINFINVTFINQNKSEFVKYL